MLEGLHSSGQCDGRVGSDFFKKSKKLNKKNELDFWGKGEGEGGGCT